MTLQTELVHNKTALFVPSPFPHYRTSSSLRSSSFNDSCKQLVRSHYVFHPRSSLSPRPNIPDSPTPKTSPSPTPKSSTSLPNRWAVVSAASLVHALHAACVYLGPTTLMSPMRHSLNLSITQITWPLTAFRIVQAIFLVPSGILLDRVGPQICLRISLTAAALMAPFLPFVTSLSQLLWLQSFFGLTKLFGGLSAMLLIAAQAFPDGDGLATATSILFSGYSLAGFIAPAFIGTLADTLGWRFASLILSIIFIVVALPLTFHFLRDRDTKRSRPTISSLFRFTSNRTTTINSTESSSNRRRTLNSTSGMKKLENKQKPGNSRSSDKSVLSRDAEDMSTSADVLITKPYLLITTAVASFSFSMHIVFDHLIVFLGEDFGMPFCTATKYMSTLNLVALFGKLGVGPLAERYSKSLLISLFAVVAAIACTLLLDFTGLGIAVTTSYVKVKAFVALCRLHFVSLAGNGTANIRKPRQQLTKTISFWILLLRFTDAIGYAAVFTLTTAILPDLGKERLGLRSSFNFMVLYAAGSLGSYMAGLFRSHTGTYKWAFVSSALAWVVVGLAGIAYYIANNKSNHTILDSNPHASNREKASIPLPPHPFAGPDG